jgi:outer membrane protein insertion porin family
MTWDRALQTLLAGIVLFLFIQAPPASAQDTTYRADANTQVRTLDFRFTTTQSFKEDDLRARISLTQRGSFTGLREFFSFLPMVEPVGEHPFDPVELQKDVVRLRSLYRRAGFRNTGVSYEFSLDPLENLIDITFVIDEGDPILLDTLRLIDLTTGSGLILEGDVQNAWGHSAKDLLPVAGERLNLLELGRLEARTGAWFTERGFPFVTTSAATTVDSFRNTATLDLRVNLGPRAHIGTITVSGQESVGEGVIRRELPFREGDLYTPVSVLEGRREILGLGLFRRANIRIAEGIPPSSTVPIQVEVAEGPIRLVTGAAGYDSRGGMTAQAEWMHRNFTGDARTLSISALAQTGVWATEDIPEILYKGSVSLTQPYLFHRRLSVVGSPFLEYRDDYRDKSVAVGFLTTFIYQVDPLRTAALVYTISDRRVSEVRYGEYASGAIDILSLLSIVARGDRVLKNSLGLQLSYGSLDDFTIPRQGYLIRPTLETTFLPGLNSVEYMRFDVRLFGFQPVGEHIGLAARIAAGSILPFGKGLPQGEEEATMKFLQLRDVIFTAGGPDDVRAWASRLLGPKAPDIRVTSTSPDTTLGIEGYIPVGGLSRLTFSLECRLPFPGLGSAAGISVYLDGARVWNAQPEFQSVTGWDDEDRFFFGTGLGFLYRLPVGTLRVDAGYKLNPSFQDLRDAEDLWMAIAEGRPTDEIPAEQIKRFYVHLSISVTF